VNRWDIAIVGGGIVGLATALALVRRDPSRRLVVLEKERGVGLHQTGRNSGVIHSGIYYPPGSSKARTAAEGRRTLVAFCRAHGVAHELCGKVIVATRPRELPLLERLRHRGEAAGLAVRRLDPGALREIEPHAAGLAALHVPDAGIVDFEQVARALARVLADRGVEIHLGVEVGGLHPSPGGVTVETSGGSVDAALAVNCAGLQSDRVARRGGVEAGVRIVPFRGEYWDLVPARRHLVKHLVYPVPDPRFPFLGVHLTRTVDGRVHAGPNAVLALGREGYGWRDVRLRDTAETFAWPGFWRLAGRHGATGAREMVRSLSRRLFAKSLQRLVPEIGASDLVPAAAGVRAQALRRDGTLVDDFLLLTGRRSVHVLNAPSPAATACLAIGETVADRVDRLGPGTSPRGTRRAAGR
jgi:(S)-2-hydroxyglutarate dehydrogenase